VPQFQIFFDFFEKCGFTAFRGMKGNLFVTKQTAAFPIDNGQWTIDNGRFGKDPYGAITAIFKFPNF